MIAMTLVTVSSGPVHRASRITGFDIDRNFIDPACLQSPQEDIQQIAFHESGNYSGNYQSFCSNQAGIQDLPGYARSARFLCIDRGVWILQFLNKDGVPSVTGILASGNIGRLCITFTEKENLRWTSVRYLASANLSASVLSLYEGRYRDAELRLDGNEVRLPEPVAANSFALTGEDGFTIYSGTDFNGESECIVPGPNDPLKLGLTFWDHISMKSVGSVRRGCQIPSRSWKSSMSVDTTFNLQGDPEVLSKVKTDLFL